MKGKALGDKRILLVEDEYFVAHDIARFLEFHGATVIGPAGTLDAAFAHAREEALDAAVLDVNLRNQLVYPVADLLIEKRVPVVFVTGYDELLMQRAYLGLPRCTKPLNKEALLRLLVRETS